MAEYEARHRKLVADIQRLIAIYNQLPPEIRLEILRFLKTPELVVDVNLKAKHSTYPDDTDSHRINYFVV